MDGQINKCRCELTYGVRLKFPLYVRALLGNMEIAGEFIWSLVTNVNNGVLKTEDI